MGPCSPRLCPIICKICWLSFSWGGSHESACGSTPSDMWSFAAFMQTRRFFEDTWAPLKRRHGLLSIRWAVDCFRFDEQEVHMHSTKNVNETHSTRFLVETGLDLGIRRRRRNGSPRYSPLWVGEKLKTWTGNESLGLKRKGIVWDENVLRNSQSVTLWGHMGPLVPPICCDKKKKQNIKTMLLLWYSESSNTLLGFWNHTFLLKWPCKAADNGDVSSRVACLKPKQ